MKASKIVSIVLLNAVLLFTLLVGLPSGVAVAPVVAQTPALKIFLPLIQYVDTSFDTYEPNNSRSEAYGPLVSGTTYTSYISTDNDDDYYSIDVKTPGLVTVDLSNINSPTTDIDVDLYNESGVQVARSWSSSSTEQINFLPLAVGRYYIRVYYCCGANTPRQPYNLKATFNKSIGSGDIWGTVMANGAVKADAPVVLYLDDYNTETTTIFQTMTDSSGKFHLRGRSALATGQEYNVMYDGSLGPDYAGYAGVKTIATYKAGKTVAAGAIDISPIHLISPVSSETPQPLPIQFTWSVRPTSPIESYYLRVYNSSYDQYWWSNALGHVGAMNMGGLPDGYGTNRLYYWRIYASSPDGSYAGSYFSHRVVFSAGSGSPVLSAESPEALSPKDLIRNRFSEK